MSNKSSNNNNIDNHNDSNKITTIRSDNNNLNDNGKLIFDVTDINGAGTRIADHIDWTISIACSNNQEGNVCTANIARCDNVNTAVESSTGDTNIGTTTDSIVTKSKNSNSYNHFDDTVSSSLLPERLSKLNITQNCDDNKATSDKNKATTMSSGLNIDDNSQTRINDGVPSLNKRKDDDNINYTMSSTGYDDANDADTAILVKQHLSHKYTSKQTTSSINRKAMQFDMSVDIQQRNESSADDSENKTNLRSSDNYINKETKRRISILKNPNPGGDRASIVVDSTDNVAKATTEESSSELMKRVSFTTVQIKQYAMELGDNPSCSHGPPVQLSWEIVSDDTFSYDDYSVSKRSKSKKINFYTQCLERNDSSSNKNVSNANKSHVDGENYSYKSQSTIQSRECTDNREASEATCQHNNENNSKSTKSNMQQRTDASDCSVNAKKVMDINHYEELRMSTRRLKPKHYVLNSLERHRIVRNAGHTHQAIESAIKSVMLAQQQRMRSNFFPLTVERKIRHISKKLSFSSLATKTFVNKLKGRNSGSSAGSANEKQRMTLVTIQQPGPKNLKLCAPSSI